MYFLIESKCGVKDSAENGEQSVLTHGSSLNFLDRESKPTVPRLESKRLSIMRWENVSDVLGSVRGNEKNNIMW